VGWCQTLKSSSKITNEEVDQILKKIGAKNFMGLSGRTSWGWSVDCDIQRDEKGNILFSGSWTISGETKLPQEFAQVANGMGYKVTLTKRQ
jgi:hypothetical protein